MILDESTIVIPLPNDETINSLECYCDVKLPEDYVSFIKKYNGVIPKTNIFTFKKQEYVVERFLCMLEKPREDLRNGQYDIRVVCAQIETRLIEDEDLIGPNVIPIATLFSGNFLCFDYRDGKKPFLAIWFHEESDDFNPVLLRIGDSFKDFLNMLKN